MVKSLFYERSGIQLEKPFSDAFQKLRMITMGKIHLVFGPARKNIENYFRKSI